MCFEVGLWKGDMNLKVSTGLTEINMKVSEEEKKTIQTVEVHLFTLTEMCMKESGKRVLHMEFSIHEIEISIKNFLMYIENSICRTLFPLSFIHISVRVNEWTSTVCIVVFPETFIFIFVSPVETFKFISLSTNPLQSPY